MNVKRHKSAAAVTLIEIMISILIITIVIIGSSFLFVTGRNQISLREHYRVAAQLAAQKLEELKAGSYAQVVNDSNSISLEGFSYTRKTVVEDVNSLYKKVTVTVDWGQGTDAHDVNMVTLIAP